MHVFVVQAGEWEAAAACQAEFESAGGQVNKITRDALIRCYGSAGAWDRAMSLYRLMQAEAKVRAFARCPLHSLRLSDMICKGMHITEAA